VQVVAFVLLAVAAAFGYWSWRNHRAIADRERERFFAALRRLRFRIEGSEPWTAKGEHGGHAVAVTTEPVAIGVPGRINGTRVTVLAPTGVERACAYLRSSSLERWAELDALEPVPLSPGLERKLVARAKRPSDLEVRFDEEKQRWVERRGEVLWIEIGPEATTLCVDGRIESVPRLLDCLDFATALVDRRPLERPLVVPKRRLLSYWSAAFAASVVALPATFWVCFLVPAWPFSSAGRRDLYALALSLDLVWGALMVVVGLSALISPVEPERTE